MRLTKLYIHNYKSFYDTTIELDKMNIVVGENNSGKSNLIDVLEFIDIAMSKDIERAISQKGGYDNIKNYNINEEKVIVRATFEECEIIEKINHKDGGIILSFSFLKDYSIFSVYMDIELQIDKVKEIPLKFILSNKKYYLNNKKNQKLFIYPKIDKDAVLDNIYMLFKYILTMAVDPNLNIESRKKLYIKTYAFNAEIIRKESHKKSTNYLKKDGSNLGQNLFYLNENSYSNSFELISNSMIGIVNEIDAVDVQETFGNYLIGFHEKNKSIGIDVVSDGTINLLATVTALNQNYDESLLLAFDEPERYLHLKAINYLLESFRASEKQILITTHSTEILKYANLDEIVFIYRDADGDTQSIRANKIDGLKDMLKELSYERDLTLDELIADGVIGDFK